MKGFKDSKGKFHPITEYKGVRKSRDQSVKSTGIKIERKARDLNEIDMQIRNLEFEKQEIKESTKKKAEKEGWFSLLNTEFESSSQRTPEYLTFHRLFKKEFSKFLRDTFDINKIEISKPNHFDATGFFSLKNGKIFYFNIGDLRWNKTFLIRTANNFQDYTGGMNNMLDTQDFENFQVGLKRVVLN